MIELLLLSLSAAVGAVARVFITEMKVFDRFDLPYGTFAVNTTGAFLMGLAMPLIAQENILYFMIIFGFLGGFTTYSAFAMDQLRLFRDKDMKGFVKYSFMMLFFCLVALALGLMVGVSIGT